MANSPTQRSLAYLKSEGYDCYIVERWNQWAKVRQDLFGFIDIVVLDGKPGLLGIQTTSGGNITARQAKIEASVLAKKWLAAGLRLEVHGWRKLKGRWQPIIRVATLDAYGNIFWSASD